MPADSPTPGSHLLGPHVIGQRVVIRRLLPGEVGPSGAPAMTDVLGICVSWADGRTVVRREDGVSVSIATADIISGKPVPPRPSIRHRVSPREAQLRAFALFPDLVTESLGEWILRSSQDTSARRANSVLAMSAGPAARQTSLPGPVETVDRVTQWYAAQRRQPIAAVLVDSPECHLFLDAGWGPESSEPATQFLVASVSHALRARVGTHHVTLEQAGSLATARIGSEKSGVVASGVAAYADDWVGFRGIEVVPDQRRAGHGLAIMTALLQWGAQLGARTAYLQVLGDNAPALALYGRLAFSVHHEYRYLAAPTSS